MPRTARAAVGGYCYHVLNRENGRARVFHDDDYQRFVGLLRQACRRPMECPLFTNVTKGADGKFTLRNAKADKPFDDVVNYFDKLAIKWEVSWLTGGAIWGDAGTSHNLVYITFSDPAKIVDDPWLLQTFVDYGSRKGAGLKDATEIRDAIWSNFSVKDKEGKWGPANAKRAVDGKALHYYGSWDFPATGQYGGALLVWTLDGQCGAWAPFFAYTILAQGLNLNMHIATIIATNPYERNANPTGELFLVQNWDFWKKTNQDAATKVKYPFINFVGPPLPKDQKYLGGALPRFEGKDYDWKYVWDKAADPDVTDDTGIPGQNKDNPASAFPNHCVVKIGDKYYDPSYGVIHNSLVDLQNNAIAAFYRIKKDAIAPNGKKVRAMLIRIAPTASDQGGQIRGLEIQEV